MNDDIDEPDLGTWTFNGVSFEGVINEKDVAVTCFFYEEGYFYPSVMGAGLWTQP